MASFLNFLTIKESLIEFNVLEIKKNCEVLMILEKSFWETGFDFFTKKKKEWRSLRVG